MLIPIIISISIKSFINKKRYSKSINMIITIFSSITSIFLVLMLIGFAAFHIVTEPKQSDLSNIKFNLTSIIFGYKENPPRELYTDFNKSIIAQRLQYSDDNLDCKIFQSGHSWVIGLDENRLFSTYKKACIDLEQPNTNLPKEVKVYFNNKRKSFILVARNKIIDIKKHFNNISDDDFLNVVYTKLLN